jgi:hypothetical protein
MHFPLAGNGAGVSVNTLYWALAGVGVIVAIAALLLVVLNRIGTALNNKCDELLEKIHGERPLVGKMPMAVHEFAEVERLQLNSFISYWRIQSITHSSPKVLTLDEWCEKYDAYIKSVHAKYDAGDRAVLKEESSES